MGKLSTQGSRSYLLLIAGAGALGGMLFGYDTAVISGAIDFLQKHFHLTDSLKGFAASSLIIGAMAGTVIGGPLSDRTGRKSLLFASALLFAVSGVLTAICTSFSLYVVSRFIGGIAIGAVSVVSPLYISEVSPGKVRGQMVSLYQLAIVGGILIVFFVNLLIQQAGSEAWNIAFGWRWMFASLTLPAALLVVISLLIPESPRWLMMVGKTDEARSTLSRVGGQEAAESGILEIESSLHEETGSILELLTPTYRRPLMIGILLAVLCQFSGINAIMYFAPSIFSASGAALRSSFVDTVLIGVVNLIFTFVAIWLVDKLGRRSLLIGGSGIQMVALLAVGAAFHFHLSGVLLLVPILVFIAAFASGMGPIPWVIISEIFPTKIRGGAMAAATLVLWASDFIVAQTFPIFNQDIGPAKTFWLYAFFSFLGLIVSWKLVVETKGRSLEQIEASWRTAPIRPSLPHLGP
jgi:SP family arabinose:H+ symporter-like MFS transporter